MRMKFLGTGGGRIAVTQQLRGTGGLVLEMDGETIHIDPGPGSLVRARQHGFDVSKVSCVAVSHCHPDHYADAELVIEAMNQGPNQKGGVLLGNIHTIEGGEAYRPVFSPYHLKSVGEYYVMKPGREIDLGKIRAKATPTFHGDPEGLGFVFSGSKKVGYASDGSYFAGQEKHFKGCDYLILNVLRPRGKDWPKHMNTEQAAKLIGLSKPGAAIITHFGVLMIKAGPAAEAEYIRKKTGIETVAARDGMVISDDEGEKEGKGLERWA